MVTPLRPLFPWYPMPRSSTRTWVFAGAVALYALGIATVVLFGIPSAMTTGVVLVAATTWAFGPRAGVVVVVLEESIAFVVLSSGVLPLGPSPTAILVPVVFMEAVVVAAIAALRRAEFRRAAAEAQLREKNAQLESALAEVKELRGMLPICAWCKCVRDVNGLWDKLEAYLARHSRATLTHGICPTCMDRVAREAGLPPAGCNPGCNQPGLALGSA